MDLVGEVAGQCLAGQVDHAHAGRQSAAAVVTAVVTAGQVVGQAVPAQQRGHRAGHGVDQGDLVPGGQLGEGEDVLGDHDRAADGEWEEQLVHRDVEAHGGAEQHPGEVGGGVGVGGPAEHGVDAALGDRDALGAAGGAGGVEDVGQCVGGRVAGGGARGGRVERGGGAVAVDVEEGGARAVQQVLMGAVGEHDGCLRVTDDQFEAVARIGRVERHVGSAGP